jgi:hypothetical protein
MPMTVRDSGCVKTTIAASLFLAMAQTGLAADQKFKPINVKRPTVSPSPRRSGAIRPAPKSSSFMVSHRAIFPGYARSTATSPKSSAS